MSVDFLNERLRSAGAVRAPSGATSSETAASVPNPALSGDEKRAAIRSVAAYVRVTGAPLWWSGRDGFWIDTLGARSTRQVREMDALGELQWRSEDARAALDGEAGN